MRDGNTTRHAGVKGTTPQAEAIAKEVARCIEKSAGLVQASLEHLETAERLWDNYLAESGTTIDGYPTAVHVVSFTQRTKTITYQYSVDCIT